MLWIHKILELGKKIHILKHIVRRTHIKRVNDFANEETDHRLR